MKNKEIKEAIKLAYGIGSHPMPHLQVKSIGTKYVICTSVVEGQYDVKYSFIEFYYAFIAE